MDHSYHMTTLDQRYRQYYKIEVFIVFYVVLRGSTHITGGVRTQKI